jgi:hypothetical protein
MDKPHTCFIHTAGKNQKIQRKNPSMKTLLGVQTFEEEDQVLYTE